MSTAFLESIDIDLKSKLLEMAENYHEQDNCGTASPFYHVVKRPVAKYSRDINDSKYNAERVILFDTEIYTPEFWIECSDEDAKYWRYDVSDLDEFFYQVEEKYEEAEILYCWYEDETYTDCGTFLTRKAAQQFIDSNRHHVGQDAYIYVEYAWRNRDAEIIHQLMTAIYSEYTKP